ncbi:hypothetical protein BAY61_22575 [Prauserella marina]|uniref:Histidine kinase n=1 Tax=Prauserella marina TaxID=530584 RepID=A0A222VUC3_9PSEU|nr:histidine kinase [Prauserella marina]ASR37323.1 hypothetical protein BAY61_22575 [Prauserella marina]PWV74823.1 histidine kinase [Prauserella marina]SDD39763.1 Histidine kinase [Prauserella marina]
MNPEPAPPHRRDTERKQAGRELDRHALDELLTDVRHRLADLTRSRDQLQGLLDAVLATSDNLDLRPTLQRIVQVATKLADARCGTLEIPDQTRLAEPSVFTYDNHDLPRTEPGSPGARLPCVLPPTLTGISRTEIVVGALAAVASVTVANAKLFERSRLRERWLTAMAKVNATLFAGAPTEDTLRVVAMSAQELAAASAVLVLLGERHGTDLLVSAAAGEGVEELVGHRFDETRPRHRRCRPHRQRQLALLGERDRIAQELHDHVIQRLFATGMGLQGTLRHITDDNARRRIVTAVDRLDQVVKEIRVSVFDLHEDLGYGKTSMRQRILDAVAELTGDTRVSPTIHVDGTIDTAVGDELGAHAEAVVREGVSNAPRHSGATELAVDVRVTGQLRVVITDNGSGIHLTTRRSGLRNVRARAARLGGAATLTRSEAGGTTLTGPSRSRGEHHHRSRPGRQVRWSTLDYEGSSKAGTEALAHEARRAASLDG